MSRTTIAACLGLLACAASLSAAAGADQRPNILIAISDDQSFPHASAYGFRAVSTPGFDRVAREGVLFNRAFSPAPGCSPMRAALLTGRQIWQIEEAGTHASTFPTKYEVYQDRLEASGYHVGYTGKGWGPGNWKVSGRERNPAGPQYAKRKLKPPGGIAATDYAANFADFLADRPAGHPFSFWYGASEPHRAYERGIGRANGLDPQRLVVPPFLPDTPEVREDLLDYCFEIQWFDQHLVRMLELLDEAGELANTLVIVTSDNGMSFPRAKANVYEYGIHMPLAIAWPARVAGGRVADDLVSSIDLTATIYEAAEVDPPTATPIAGQSLLRLLVAGDASGAPESRDAVYSGRERHSSSRFNSLGYPQRAIRTADFLYIRNFRPERWPAGAPQRYASVAYDAGGEPAEFELGAADGGYADIDACPTLKLMVERREDPAIAKFLQLAVDHRPAEELFCVRDDPGCLNDLAADPAFADVKSQLSERLLAYLRSTGDPRVVAPDGGEVWETYPRYSPLRWFPKPDWASEDPGRVPPQPWLEEQRPRVENGRGARR